MPCVAGTAAKCSVRLYYTPVCCRNCGQVFCVYVLYSHVLQELQPGVLCVCTILTCVAGTVARCSVRLYYTPMCCRNCGQVFCAECTNFYTPVPQQHLNCPVRVCNRCYQLMKTNGHSFVLDGASSTIDCLGDAARNTDLPIECSCTLLRGRGFIAADCQGVQSQTNGVESTADCPNCNGWLDAERRPLETDATLEVQSA